MKEPKRYLKAKLHSERGETHVLVYVAPRHIALGMSLDEATRLAKKIKRLCREAK